MICVVLPLGQPLYSSIMDELAGLSEEARALALDRFRLLQPHLEQNRPLRSVALETGIPFRTAQRWVAQYQRFGLAALARKKRDDSGERRAVSARIKEAIEGLALQKPPLTVAMICRQARRFAQEIGEPSPKYAVVYDIVRNLPADLLTLAHQGGKAYGDAFELVHRREAVGPNAIWQADHSPLDILLIRPDGKPGKPWLTVIIDDYSRAVPGYFLSFEDPSALHTSLALRQAIWRKEDARWNVCGIPEALYTDHGSDFTSRHLEQVGADLKIRLVFSIPGKPRGRGRIERFFSTVNEMFLCELDGYAPPGRGVRGEPTLTLAEFDARFRAFLLDVYHRRKCAEMNTPPTERTSTTLAAYVGESVTLRIDPRDMGEVRVFHEERFLCRAICAELAGETVPLREIIRARNRRKKELRSVLRDRQQTVDTLLAIKRADVQEMENPQPPKPTPITQPGTTLKRYRNE